MAPVIPFRRRSFFPSLLIALGAVALAIIGFAVVTAFLNFQSSRSGGVEQTKVEILPPTPNQSAQIDVIDGDTVRFNRPLYPLAAFDTTKLGGLAPCDAECP